MIPGVKLGSGYFKLGLGLVKGWFRWGFIINYWPVWITVKMRKQFFNFPVWMEEFSLAHFGSVQVGSVELAWLSSAWVSSLGLISVGLSSIRLSTVQLTWLNSNRLFSARFSSVLLSWAQFSLVLFLWGSEEREPARGAGWKDMGGMLKGWGREGWAMSAHEERGRQCCQEEVGGCWGG